MAIVHWVGHFALTAVRTHYCTVKEKFRVTLYALKREINLFAVNNTVL